MKSLLVLVTLVGSVAAQTISCNADYQKVASHTLCRQRSPAFKSGGVSAADIQSILDKHNNYRKNPLPPAKPAAMQKLYWDDKLAAVAQKHAESCKFEHDTDVQRKVVGFGVYNGQNLAMGYGSWAAAVDGWFSEVKDFKYGQAPTGVVGHYTQVAYEDTPRLGCGFADCTTPGRIYVCNYANGQMTNKMQTPFKIAASKACEGCPNKCADGLCDCGGKICENGGTMDLTTCSCKCASIYSGDSCSKIVCPAADKPYCGTGKSFPPDYCEKYSNVPGECPKMCKLC